MLSADMTKEADLRCEREFKGTDVKGLLAVHDALVFLAPGRCEIDWEKSENKNGVWTKLKFKVDAEAKEIADRIVKIMEDVETEMFQDVGSPILGKAEAGISLYWNH
jgi:hypothetical protein